MMKFWIRIFNWFAKITGFIPFWLAFRTKIYYVDRKLQGRHIKGPAIIMSNHIQLFDYVVWLFVFWTRTIRTQAAEVLYRRPMLGPLLKQLGAIYVNRETRDFSFCDESVQLLKEGWVLTIFPEARLPKKGEERPLPFKMSAAYIALQSGAPVIPVVTDGSYFNFRRRARVLIGTPVYAKDLREEGVGEKENLRIVADKFRSIIRNMTKELSRRSGNPEPVDNGEPPVKKALEEAREDKR
ncbi:MAG: 1-acyl-sn-glycerol-3-phosphate acyltransferase [Lachnospiraceae bacterium]|nr:1-acyl-sn-glycerol-3-phosphate acyltransferase [Lachnospiraceae bacterium]